MGRSGGKKKSRRTSAKTVEERLRNTRRAVRRKTPMPRSGVFDKSAAKYRYKRQRGWIVDYDELDDWQIEQWILDEQELWD